MDLGSISQPLNPMRLRMWRPNYVEYEVNDREDLLSGSTVALIAAKDNRATPTARGIDAVSSRQRYGRRVAATVVLLSCQRRFSAF
jgi:hypothetical protein